MDNLDDIIKIINDGHYQHLISTDYTNDDFSDKCYVDGDSYRSTEEILDELPIEEIENYLRKKKLQKLKSKL